MFSVELKAEMRIESIDESIFLTQREDKKLVWAIKGLPTYPIHVAEGNEDYRPCIYVMWKGMDQIFVDLLEKPHLKTVYPYRPIAKSKIDIPSQYKFENVWLGDALERGQNQIWFLWRGADAAPGILSCHIWDRLQQSWNQLYRFELRGIPNRKITELSPCKMNGQLMWQLISESGTKIWDQRGRIWADVEISSLKVLKIATPVEKTQSLKTSDIEIQWVQRCDVSGQPWLQYPNEGDLFSLRIVWKNNNIEQVKGESIGRFSITKINERREELFLKPVIISDLLPTQRGSSGEILVKSEAFKFSPHLRWQIRCESSEGWPLSVDELSLADLPFSTREQVDSKWGIAQMLLWNETYAEQFTQSRKFHYEGPANESGQFPLKENPDPIHWLSHKMGDQLFPNWNFWNGDVQPLFYEHGYKFFKEDNIDGLNPYFSKKLLGIISGYGLPKFYSQHNNVGDMELQVLDLNGRGVQSLVIALIGASGKIYAEGEVTSAEGRVFWKSSETRSWGGDFFKESNLLLHCYFGGQSWKFPLRGEEGCRAREQWVIAQIKNLKYRLKVIVPWNNDQVLDGPSWTCKWSATGPLLQFLKKADALIFSSWTEDMSLKQELLLKETAENLILPLPTHYLWGEDWLLNSTINDQFTLPRHLSFPKWPLDDLSLDYSGGIWAVFNKESGDIGVSMFKHTAWEGDIGLSESIANSAKWLSCSPKSPKVLMGNSHEWYWISKQEAGWVREPLLTPTFSPMETFAFWVEGEDCFVSINSSQNTVNYFDINGHLKAQWARGGCQPRRIIGDANFLDQFVFVDARDDRLWFYLAKLNGLGLDVKVLHLNPLNVSQGEILNFAVDLLQMRMWVAFSESQVLKEYKFDQGKLSWVKDRPLRTKPNRSCPMIYVHDQIYLLHERGLEIFEVNKK